MKKLLTIISAIALITLVSANLPGDIDKSMAKVNQTQGYYLFVDSTPVAEYEYLGTVKNKVGLSDLEGSDDFIKVKKRLIKKAKKDFPEGNGLIFNIENTRGEADVIKFK